MKIGFIGAGKAGCSLGKYFSEKAGLAETDVTGYYSLIREDAKWAAAFTGSTDYGTVNELIEQSETIILSTPDGAIKKVWDSLDKDQVKGRIFCHLSGSLSSDVFSGIEEYGGYPISIHPMFAFSDKESVYRQLNQVKFTIEGNSYAVSEWKKIFQLTGNPVVEISREYKLKYHAAASLLSNHVIAVLETGYRLLGECGFSPEEAREFSSVLVRDNVEHVICSGAEAALTGPIERGDCETVSRHISVLDDAARQIYMSCGRQLLAIAKRKNPDRDYADMDKLMKG